MYQKQIFVSQLLVILLIFQTLNPTSANVYKKLQDEETFTHLGTFEHKDSLFRRTAYFISDHKLSQDLALLECEAIYAGRLLTIYTAEEDDFVRLRLQALQLDREQVHTAGRYNADAEPPRWEWSTTKTELVYQNWRENEPQNPTAGYCIDLLGASDSSAYGWVSRYCGNVHRFICQI